MGYVENFRNYREGQRVVDRMADIGDWDRDVLADLYRCMKQGPYRGADPTRPAMVIAELVKSFTPKAFEDDPEQVLNLVALAVAKRAHTDGRLTHQAIVGLMLHKAIGEENYDTADSIVAEYLDGDPNEIGGVLARSLGAVMNYAGLEPDSQDAGMWMPVNIVGLSIGEVFGPQAGSGYKLFVAGARKDHEEYDRIVAEELDGDDSGLPTLMFHALTGMLGYTASQAGVSVEEARSRVIGAYRR